MKMFIQKYRYICNVIGVYVLEASNVSGVKIFTSLELFPKFMK